MAGSITITGTGIGEPGCTPGPIQVYDCGVDGVCHDSDDVELGWLSASSNNGNFTIVLAKVLVLGQKIYVTDGCADPALSQPATVGSRSVAPLMSRELIVVLAAALGFVGLLGLRRMRL